MYHLSVIENQFSGISNNSIEIKKREIFSWWEDIVFIENEMLFRACVLAEEHVIKIFS